MQREKKLNHVDVVEPLLLNLTRGAYGSTKYIYGSTISIKSATIRMLLWISGSMMKEKKVCFLPGGLARTHGSKEKQM